MKKWTWGMRLGVIFIFILVGTALAVQTYMNDFNTQYGTLGTALDTCSLCHPAGGPTDATNLNNFATDYAANNYSFTAIEGFDSDGDGFTNIVEITARTFPGDPTSFPADTTPPLVMAFVIPATSASLTVPITTFTATDLVGVTGYILTEAANPAPAAGAAGWTGTAPATYTFASAGAKTLYAWAKDAAGNVSTSLNASVAITLSDAIAPTVTAFVIPATWTSLTVPITTFTATDNVAVTGYFLTESITTPLASDPGWQATAPVNHTFASIGSKTLYAWAKDAAGLVSTSLSASVVIALPSLQAPGLVSPANGSGAVTLTPTLQISVSFPDATGNSHKSTDWQVSGDAIFAPASTVFSAIQDSVNLTSLVVPPGILRPGRTYYWRARTTNSADTASPYAAASSFTTAAVAMDLTGTLPDVLAVKSGGVQISNLSALSPAQLAAAGNISPQLVSGPNSVPIVNAGDAGAGTNLTLPGMMIVKANGGAGADVLGVVTPAGTVIENVTTAATAGNPAFATAAPVGVSLPYGVVSFRIRGITPGASVNVTLYTPSDLPAGAIWCKYSPTLGWLKIDSAGTYNSSGLLVSANTRFNVVSGRGVLTIQDDDVTDFSTELAAAGNAVILDPGGPGLPSTVGPASDTGNGSRCFIATAAFGSPLDPHVRILREFRDTFLLASDAGRRFVEFYYRVSPGIAMQVGASEPLRIAVRIALLPAIGFSLLALKVGMPGSLGLLLATLGVAVLVRRRYARGRPA
jgi:hypothetical protein